MFCQNCGKEVGEGDRFCKNCGVLIGDTREGQDQPGQTAGESRTGWQDQSAADQGAAFQKEPDSFSQGEQRPSSSRKMVTWVIVGAVALIGLISLLLLIILNGAARRKAEPRMQQWREQIEEYQDDRFYDYDFDSDDEDDFFDDEDDDEDDSFVPDTDEKQGGEQFF